MSQLNNALEDAEKSAQSASLLLQDLQSLNRNGDEMISMIVLPYIEEVSNMKRKLDQIASYLTMKCKDEPANAPRG